MAKRINNRWQGYTAADCDCMYCLHYGGTKNKEVQCLVEECFCIEELKEAICQDENRLFKGVKIVK